MNNKRLDIHKSSSLRDNSLAKDVFYVIFALFKDVTIETLKLGEAYVDLWGGKRLYDACHKFDGWYISKEEKHYLEKGNQNNRRKEWEIKKAIRRLKENKYIRLDDKSEKLFLENKGILEFIKYNIKRKQQEKWDKKWRVIIFDVKENRRKSRDFLRTRLKWLGFKELQKSVWAFPYDIKREMEELMIIAKHNPQDDIRFLVVEKIEEDKDLRKWFNLK